MKVAGIGCREGATLADLRAVLSLMQQRPDALASTSSRVALPALQHLATYLALPLLALEEDEIAGEQTLTCSPRIKARFATGSLAEACAQVAARKGLPGMDPARSRLIAPRVVTADGMATAALAERLEP